MLNHIFLPFVVLLSFLFHPVLANTVDHSQSASGWLGLSVRPLPPELRIQLANHLKNDEGVLVSWVETNSPAQQAGVQKFDVLVSFDGQKLYSNRQLKHLVRASEPDKAVKLMTIRTGQVQELTVTPAKKNTRTLGRTKRFQQPLTPPQHPRLDPFQFQQDISGWDQFESIQINTLSQGRYRASVTFKDHQNETKSFTFEGEKQQIIDQIKLQQDLPDEKKQALLRALNFEQTNPFNRNQWNDMNRWLNRFLDDKNFFQSPWQNDPFFSEPFYPRPFNQPWEQYDRQAPWQFHYFPQLPPRGYR